MEAAGLKFTYPIITAGEALLADVAGPHREAGELKVDLDTLRMNSDSDNQGYLADWHSKPSEVEAMEAQRKLRSQRLKALTPKIEEIRVSYLALFTRLEALRTQLKMPEASLLVLKAHCPEMHAIFVENYRRGVHQIEQVHAQLTETQVYITYCETLAGKVRDHCLNHMAQLIAARQDGTDPTRLVASTFAWITRYVSSSAPLPATEA